MSSLFRQRILFYQVQCRAQIDSAFRFTRYNTELKSTAHCALPGTVSSSNRQRIMFTGSSVELISTAYCVLPGQMLSPNRQHISFYQVQCRAPVDSALLFTRSNVVLNSTARSVYQVQCRAQIDKLFAMFCDVLCDFFFVRFCHLRDTFKNSNVRGLL